MNHDVHKTNCKSSQVHCFRTSHLNYIDRAWKQKSDSNPLLSTIHFYQQNMNVI